MVDTETLAARILAEFLRGEPPHLIAIELAVTPTAVIDQIRASLREHVEVRGRLRRGGRKPIYGRPMTDSERQRRCLAKKSATKASDKLNEENL